MSDNEILQAEVQEKCRLKVKLCKKVQQVGLRCKYLELDFMLTTNVHSALLRYGGIYDAQRHAL